MEIRSCIPRISIVFTGRVFVFPITVAPMHSTRGQLLTGLDAARNGAVNVTVVGLLLHPVSTIANFYGEAGYSTGVFGKCIWEPIILYYRTGVLESVWYPSSSIPPFPPIGEMIILTMFIFTTGRKAVRGLLCDVFFNEAIRFMSESASKSPLCVILPPFARSVLPKEEDRKEIAEVLAQSKFDRIIISKTPLSYWEDSQYRLEHGQLMKFLEDENLTKDTILIFKTDNGSLLTLSTSMPGCGEKDEIWEGDIVPLFHTVLPMVIWKARDVGGLTSQDLLPTLLDLCGIKPAKIPSLMVWSYHCSSRERTGPRRSYPDYQLQSHARFFQLPVTSFSDSDAADQVGFSGTPAFA